MQRAALVAAADSDTLPTPLLQISRTTVLLPLIGAVDARRAQQLTRTLLDGIAAQRARFVILDITGAAAIDTHVADTLVQIAQAARLLGAQVILTGIRATAAQAFVTLETQLTDVITTGSLHDGIRYAMAREQHGDDALITDCRL